MWCYFWEWARCSSCCAWSRRCAAACRGAARAARPRTRTAWTYTAPPPTPLMYSIHRFLIPTLYTSIIITIAGTLRLCKPLAVFNYTVWSRNANKFKPTTPALTHAHTYTPTPSLSYTHARARTHTLSHKHTRTHAHVRTLSHTYTRLHWHTHSHPHTRTLTHIDIFVVINTHVLQYTHAHTKTQTRTLTYTGNHYPSYIDWKSLQTPLLPFVTW